MSDPEQEPKLRLVDDEADRASEEVVRLSGDGKPAEPVARLVLPPAPEAAARIEGETRESFAGRTVEPGMEHILPTGDVQGSVETGWGEKNEELKKPAPYGWFVLIVLLIGVAIGMAYYSTQQGKTKVEQVRQQVDETRHQDEVKSADAAVLVEDIQKKAKAYLAASSIEQMLPYVRQPERVKPLMEDWYARHPLKTAAYREMGVFTAVSYRQEPFWRLQAILDDGSGRELLFQQMSDTTALVDWETDVGYQPMAWADFVRNRPVDGGHDFRVLIAPDAFYNYEFADDKRWASFRIAASGDDYVFGYAPVNSRLVSVIRFLCSQTPGGRAPMILRLRVPPDTKSNRAVLIDEVVAGNWIVMGDEPRIKANEEPEK